MIFLRGYDKILFRQTFADCNTEVEILKEKIHPQYFEATVTCGCGNTFKTGSTKKELRVDVCSKCHSFFTGRQRDVKAGGRIEKFNKRYKKA